MFLYDEKISKLETDIFEFKKMKNAFNEFFKFVLQQIEEITSRDEEIAAMNQDLESMYTEVENYSNQLALIVDTISKIDTDLSVEEFLNKMHNGFTNIFDVETLIIFKVNGKIYKIGSIIELSDNITKIPLIVNYGSKEKIIGNIFISGKMKFSISEMRTYDMFAKILSIFITHKIKSQQIEELYLNTIKALANAVEIKDEYTRGHSERVAKIALMFAKHLRIKDSEINVLYQASILHDIGKIGIPDAVLNKPGKLTEEEYGMIKEHPFLGYKIIMEIKGMERIATIIKYHHERWDGKGYPDGLKEENIPFLSRIIAIADSYDAMYSNRSYRKALNLEVIKEIFEKEKGKQWDPELVSKFLEIIDNIEDSDNSNL
jgi:HD-GYP domain-containing protein (c-di-GMP phosphodiesterase class II)